MNINHVLTDDTFIDDFYAFDANPSARPVDVKWGTTSLSSIVGPTPFVDISKSFNTNDAGFLESIIHTITLTGKIIQKEVRGINTVVSGINTLESLFKECSTSSLQILCDNQTIFSAAGVVIKDLSFSKTNDNWVQSADYSISLEHKTAPAASSNPNEYVEDRSESWSIEPLDDAIYTKFTKVVAQKPEYSSPNMKPRIPAVGNPVPSMSVGGGSFGGDNKIQIFNIPQFRISRRLSAKGIMPPITGNANNSGCWASPNNPQGTQAIQKKLFLYAKAWVDSQSANPFNGATVNGTIFFTSSPSISNYSGTWLYNHNRTINFDIYNATYETNDTWLAMPTGTPYTETFTIDASTDTENIKTVRVQGNIQGLVLSPTNLMTGSASPFPSGLPMGITTSGELSSSGILSGGGTWNSNNNIRLDLSYSMQDSPTAPLNYQIPSIDGNDSNTRSSITSIAQAKYLNALEAWTKDIKPYLYRRASLVMQSSDRIAKPYTDPKLPPPNPIYLPESLLNANPISTSEGHDPLKGTISYSYEFNNKFEPISGVISNIRISNTAPANVVQETQILGRALGPLLSSAGVTNPRKTISIDLVVPKPTGIKGMLQTEEECPLYYDGFIWQNINDIIIGNQPFANRTNELFQFARSQQFGTVFKDSDSEDWNPTEGRYSRTVSWIYQQCTTDRFYLDH